MDNNEFERLLKLEKHFDQPKSFRFPEHGSQKIFSLTSVCKSEKFFLDFDRSGKIVFKLTNQLRQDSTPLVRIDINSPPHINPNGNIVGRNHVHLYKEHFGLAYAYELDSIFSLEIDKTNVLDIFINFCYYCNIVHKNIDDIKMQGVL